MNKRKRNKKKWGRTDIPNNHPSPNAEGKPNSESANAKSEISGTTSSPQSPSTTPHYCITYTEKNWWDKTKPFIEIIGAVALALYTIYTIGIYRANNTAATAAKTSSETATKELELSQRPYLEAGMSLDGPLSYDVNGANINFKLALQNNGHSPAFRVAIQPKMLGGKEAVTAPDYRDALCKDTERISKTLPQFSTTIFPTISYIQAI